MNNFEEPKFEQISFFIEEHAKSIPSMEPPSKSRSEKREHFRREVDAQRHLFQLVVNNAPVGIVVVDSRELRIKWCNDQFNKLVNGSLSGHNVSGICILDFFPAAYDRMFTILNSAATTHQSSTHPEFEYTDIRGRTSYWHWSLLPLPAVGDEESDLLLLISDVTHQVNARKQIEELKADLEVKVKERTSELVETNIALHEEVKIRRDTEDALQKSNALLQKMFASIHLMIAYMDTSFNFIRVNNAYAAADDHEPDYYVGKNHFDLFPNEENERIFKRVVETGEPYYTFAKPFEYIHAPSRGVTYWDWSLQPVKDPLGRVDGVIMYLLNVTERVKMEAQLREAEKMRHELAAIVESSDDAIIGQTLDGLITSWNAGAKRMFDYSAKEVKGSPISMLVAPAHAGRLNHILEKVSHGKKVKHYEITGIKKDGTEMTLSYTASPIKSSDEKIIGTSLIVRDITELKLAEDELKRSREQLRNLSVHLQSAREEERASIAREIHDELGQALTALKMELTWLSNKLPEGHPLLTDKSSSSLKLIDATIQSVKRICSELRPALLDHLGIGAAIEWQSLEFQNRAGIECEVRIVPEDIEIGDRDLSTALFRIFQETLTNIARHAQATKVWVRLRDTGSKLVLEVRDNGKGISETEARSQKSFGLIGIRERARYWKGLVKIRGVKGKGTTVSVSIPHPGETMHA